MPMAPAPPSSSYANYRHDAVLSSSRLGEGSLSMSKEYTGIGQVRSAGVNESQTGIQQSSLCMYLFVRGLARRYAVAAAACCRAGEGSLQPRLRESRAPYNGFIHRT